MGDEEHYATTQDWQGTGPPVEAGRGGGSECEGMEAGRGREGPLYRITLGLTGTWEQVEDCKGGNRTGEGRHGFLEELLWASQHGREAQTSGGVRRAGALSRWTVSPRPGEKGGEEAGAKRERISVYG